MKGVEKEGVAPLLNLRERLKGINSMKLPSASSCYIYRVPPRIRKMNEEAYTPIMVSIGPFHHGNQRLKSMEEIKLWYLHKFLKRSTQEKPLDDYVEYVRDSEDRIRHCYSEIIPMGSDEFVSMILTDACFIIELFLTFFIKDPFPSDDPLVGKIYWPYFDIRRDLILIENQLPQFVLEGLFNQTFPTGFEFMDVKHSFLDFTTAFAKGFTPNIYYTTASDDPSYEQVEHFCDALRAFCLPSNPPSRITHVDLGLKRSYSVRKLHEVGVKLQAQEERKRLSEVKFSKGVLRIPRFWVSNLTECLLRNMVAFEQCHYPHELYMSDYVILMDFLIQSGKDAEILLENGIMESTLDCDAVASMFSDLRMNIAERDLNEGYVSLHKELDTFYNNHYNKYTAIFVRDYWSTPWKKASSTAAVLLLLLTFIQTISSVVPLFKK